jgi:hypothetical protein
MFDGAGHIVVLRPQESFPFDEGPQVSTAGVRNFKSASIKFGFGDHPLAMAGRHPAVRPFTALE